MVMKLIWQLSIAMLGLGLTLCQDIKEPKSFNGKPLIPQRVIQRREDFSRPIGHGMGRKIHPGKRHGAATKDMEEFESARATEEKREPKNEEDEYDAILKSLLQASDEKPGDKRITEDRNTSTPEDASKEKENLDGLKTNDSISDKTVMRELLSSVKEKIGSEPMSPVNDSEHFDTVASSYRLKGVRSLVTPDLLYALAAASEGELILLAPINFPSSEFSTLKNSGRRSKDFGPIVIRADGLRIPTLLREIMKLIKVSSTRPKPVILCMPGKGEPDPTVWEEYKSIIEKADGKSYEFEKMEHAKFIEAGRAASIVVLTGEDAEHSGILLTKGRVVQGHEPVTDEKSHRDSLTTTPKPAEKSTTSVPSKLEGLSTDQDRVTANKKGEGEGEEGEDATVDDLREALEALRNEN